VVFLLLVFFMLAARFGVETETAAAALHLTHEINPYTD